MTHKIALNFEDGVTRFIDANLGETVADAATARASTSRWIAGTVPAEPASASPKAVATTSARNTSRTR